jgi:hypothetical protein
MYRFPTGRGLSMSQLYVLSTASVMIACPSNRPNDASPTASATPTPTFVPPPWEPPVRPGCVRSGPLEGIETDPACVVSRADETATRDAMKLLRVELAADASTVVGGTTALVRLTLTNTSTNDVDLFFVAQPGTAATRPDWTRLAGVPELRAAPTEGFHLAMPVRTLDAHERSVDGLPTTPQTIKASARILCVRLRPKPQLTHTFSWWALQIPTPSPSYRDDAGRRIVPKTAPVALPPGEYGIAVTLPLYGVSPAEATASTHITVEKIDRSSRPLD